MITEQLKPTNIIRKCLFLLAVCCLHDAIAKPDFEGISLGGTRIVINEKEKSHSFPVKNNTLNNYIIKSDVFFIDENGFSSNKKIDCFFVEPPIDRIDSEEIKYINIINDCEGVLADDVESIFYLRVRFVPEKIDNRNIIVNALNYNIKLLYRPKGVGHSEATFKVKKEDDILYIDNASKFNLNIADILVNNNLSVKPNNEMLIIKPLSIYPIVIKGVNNKVEKITVKYIDSFGYEQSKEQVIHENN
ncbi:molecular chaperone [Providencia stuartii]|uniref:fimbrial biogenesis chaperone n=1 Tax=Providencia stuartii TaxID=588 RepID=UPI0028829978|nr:fimbria/pilus periplasmic chaperone [Providencia stuartii]MDK7737194.1 fimbria/pilus periplasmic chaperone [Providencia stuartii]HEM8345400.1 molecular chaperone [Providencia stuartii]